MRTLPTIVLLAMLLVGTATASESDGISYLKIDRPILLIENPNRQAEAWAMCAAAYDLAAEIFRDIMKQPATAQQFSNLANGAEIAVGMSLMAGTLSVYDKEDESLEQFGKQFDATLKYSKIAMVEWPKIARNTMMIDLETQKAKGEDIDQFIANVLSTVKVCAENAEGQQLHVDTFRELAKSGVLVLPED